MTFRQKRMKIIPVVLVFTLIVSLIVGRTINVKAKVLLQEDNPPFDYFVNYSGDPMNDKGWTPDPDISKITYEEEKQEYTLTSNAYVMWGNEDNVTYGYNLYRLEHGDMGKLTVTTAISKLTTIDEAKSADIHENASVGICLRGTKESGGNYASSKDAQEIFLHVRSGRVMVVYRTANGAISKALPQEHTITGWPIYLTMEKEGNAVNCSVKMGDDGVVKTFSTAYINFTEVVSVGLAGHSVKKDVPIIGVFKGYDLNIEGPATATYQPVGGETGGEEGTEEDLENVVPKDPPITDNVLFRETFTDGSLVNENLDGNPTADNPLWTNKYSINGAIETANIVTEDDNRYWKRSGTADTYIFPNLEWSDYTLDVDLKFGEGTNLQQKNQVDFFVRINAAQANGYFGYWITMQNGTSKQTVSIYKLCAVNKLKSTGALCATVDYNYINNEWATWSIEAFDNRISVYCNKELVLEFIEKPGEEIKNYAVNGLGGIGFGSEEADLMVDNIIVRKSEDLFGGSYDNKISGRWNQSVPDYLLNYEQSYGKEE